MQKSYHINQGVFGTGMHWIQFHPAKPSDKYLVCGGGRGQVVVDSDGVPSESVMNEVLQIGMPKRFNQGLEKPYNVICPVVVSKTTEAAGTYGSFNKYFPYFLRAMFRGKNAYTGLSMGGQWVDNLSVNTYLRGQIDAIVSVCGKPDNALTLDPKLMMDIPSISIHGDKDDTVLFAHKQRYVEAVNALPGRVNKIQWDVRVGVGHNVWDYAYAPNNYVEAFIDAMLAEEVVPPVNTEEFINAGRAQMHTEAMNAIAALV